MTFEMSKIKKEFLGVKCLDQIRILTTFYVLNVILPQEAFIAFVFWGDIEKIKARNSRFKSRYHKCLWTIYNMRRISSSNSINDNERHGLKMKFIYLSKTKSFSCVLENWLNVLFRRDRNLKCDPTKTTIFFILQKRKRK